MKDDPGSQAAATVDEKISEFRTLQQELSTHHADLGKLVAQRNENQLVLQELEICNQEVNDDAPSVIYKAIGPVLIKNDFEEAIETVKKRLEFISGEIDKTQAIISKKDERCSELALKIQELQSAMQKAAVEAAKVVAAGKG